MSRQWTENQKLAIDARKGSLLVSAAAGSGKTAVLVERVVLMVTDSENPVPIERLLIVTYTRAAAAELKERISKTLGKLISEHPDNKWYRRQLMYLPRAHISTVDSFCGDIVREFFQEIDAPSDYRIADNNELAIYVEDAFDKTLEHFYAEGSADFSRLIETFTTVKTDRNLKDIVKSLYDFLRSHPFEEMWLDEKLKFYTEFTGASESVWGKVIIDYAISAAEYCIDLTNASLKILEQDAELYSLSSALFLADLQYLEILHKKLVSFDNWDAISRFADSFVSGRFDAKGYKDHPFKLRAASNRNLVKATIGKIQSLFTKREDEIIKEVYSQSGIVKKMFECLVTFKEYYSQCKLSKNIADFSDIVHWTLSLLVKCNEEGNFEFTEIADTISERFDAVMVDEFQDANEVQDLIFKAVSHGGTNLFIVGDVKQSIYGFRQAMPEIFLNRKNSLPLYSRELDNYPSKVILESNFRSRSEVTDFINFVFTTIMSTAVGDMEYTKEEHLIPKAPYTPADTPCTELHLLDLDSIGEIEGMVAEARHIASVIYEKMKNTKVKGEEGERNLRFGDIAILMRYTKRSADIYANELRRYGIPVITESEAGFLSLPEIKLATDFLRVIDNPLLDIPLANVLMSAVYGFTIDDMALMRADSRKLPLYMSLKKYADKGDKKAKRVISDLDELRNISLSMPCDVFINCFYDKTSLLSISKATGGEYAYNNLCLLKEYATEFEKGINKGLSAFLNYLQRLLDNEKDLPTAVSSNPDNSNVVRIMTVHSSKGLEFPLCILANTHRKIISDKDEDIIIHSKLGFSSRIKDEELMYTYSTFPRDAVMLETVRDERSEEVRILYVALTRAKERLVILSTMKNLKGTVTRLGSTLADTTKISPFILRDSIYLSDWMIMLALMHPASSDLRDYAEMEKKNFSCVDTGNFLVNIVTDLEYDFEGAVGEVKKRVAYEEVPEDISSIIKSRFDGFIYPYEALCRIPQKVIASALAHKDTEKFFSRTLQKPRFESDSPLSAAEKGTAMHTFMQYCDYNSASEDLEKEIERLILSNRLSNNQSKVLDRNKLTAFLESDIVNCALKAEEYSREYRFTVNIPAYLADDTLTGEARNQQIILQGSIDLAIIEEDGIIIVDYKTDRIKTVSELRERYHKQLELYKYAIEQTTGKPVKSCLIYSIYLSESLEVL